MLSNLWGRLCPLKRFKNQWQKNSTKRIQNTPSASESCVQWVTCQWFWCVNLEFCSRPTTATHLNTPCQAAQNIPQLFVTLFGSPLIFSTITNTWFSLKTHHDKITALKHKSTARRLWVKACPGTTTQPYSSRTSSATKDYANRLHHRHICVLTIKTHTQQSPANNASDNANDPPSGHREDWPAKESNPLQALG